MIERQYYLIQHKITKHYVDLIDGEVFFVSYPEHAILYESFAEAKEDLVHLNDSPTLYRIAVILFRTVEQESFDV